MWPLPVVQQGRRCVTSGKRSNNGGPPRRVIDAVAVSPGAYEPRDCIVVATERRREAGSREWRWPPCLSDSPTQSQKAKHTLVVARSSPAVVVCLPVVGSCLPSDLPTSSRSRLHRCGTSSSKRCCDAEGDETSWSVEASYAAPWHDYLFGPAGCFLKKRHVKAVACWVRGDPNPGGPASWSTLLARPTAPVRPALHSKGPSKANEIEASRARGRARPTGGAAHRTRGAGQPP